MTQVMGIDSNSYGFHWATSDGGYGFFKGDGDARERRRQTFRYACDLFTAVPDGTHIFLEEALVLAKNTETTRKLVMIAGTIESAFWQANPDAWLWSVDISTWRKEVLGKGGGRKDEMKARAKERVTAYLVDRSVADEIQDEILADDNYCDAFCLMLYGTGVASSGGGSNTWA